MTDSEIAIARAALISGISLPRLIDQLESGKYGDLVEQHRLRIGANLKATEYTHEQLITKSEFEAAASVLDSIRQQAEDPTFWAATAGDVLNLVSCEFNDELFPDLAEEAGTFNVFQLATARFALRAETDSSFRSMMLTSNQPERTRDEPGLITKMLEIAVNDFEAGRLSRKNLLTIFQDAIDNGDVLLSSNEFVVVAHVIPLIDASVLNRSSHISKFEARMNLKTASFAEARRSEPKQWWRFW